MAGSTTRCTGERSNAAPSSRWEKRILATWPTSSENARRSLSAPTPNCLSSTTTPDRSRNQLRPVRARPLQALRRGAARVRSPSSCSSRPAAAARYPGAAGFQSLMATHGGSFEVLFHQLKTEARTNSGAPSAQKPAQHPSAASGAEAPESQKRPDFQGCASADAEPSGSTWEGQWAQQDSNL